MERKIISQTPGYTVYAGPKEGEVYHYFTDVMFCPYTGQELEIPGKGVISHRISAFLFSRFQQLNLPTHFIRAVNMRQSLMYDTHPLSFDIVVRFGACPVFSELFGVPEKQIFERPVIDYFHVKAQRFISESHILGMDLLEDDGDFEEMQALVLRSSDVLRGLFIGMGLQLLDVRFSLGHSLSHYQEDQFFLCGRLSPEFFSVIDLETQTVLGGSSITRGTLEICTHYQLLAARLGISLAGPHRSQILSFQNRA